MVRVCTVCNIVTFDQLKSVQQKDVNNKSKRLRYENAETGRALKVGMALFFRGDWNRVEEEGDVNPQSTLSINGWILVRMQRRLLWQISQDKELFVKRC